LSTFVPIKTAIIGIGRSAQVFHIPFLQQVPGFDWVAGVERTTDVLSTSFPKVRSYRLSKALWENEQPELVILTTPNITHETYILECLENGAHVLVDKPMVVRSSEMKRCIEKAKACQRHIFVFQNRRWDSDWLTLQQIIKRDLLGPIESIESRMDRYRPEPRLSYWKESSALGNGLWYDLGAHLLDQPFSEWGLPDSIEAELRIQRPQAQGVDWMEVVLHYSSNTHPQKILLHADMLQSQPTPRWKVEGDLGTWIKMEWDKQEAALAAGTFFTNRSSAQDTLESYGTLSDFKGNKTIFPSVEGDYSSIYRSIVGTLRENKKFPVSLEQIESVVYWLEKIQQEAVHQKVVWKL
jgi:predicted dehydrogenase